MTHHERPASSPNTMTNMETTPGQIRFDHQPITTFAQNRAKGRLARKSLPRSAQGEFVPDPNRDPLRIVAAQNATRIPELVPLRLERMLASPFAFFRGTAALQAADLASGATTARPVVLCGDAHIANFGMFASPQRTLVFDLNDFDEAALGPWEWDLKRFVTSVVIAGQHNGFLPQEVNEAALAAAGAYRLALMNILKLDALERYYRHAEVTLVAEHYGKQMNKVVNRAIKAAKRRTSAYVLAKITERASDGTISIIEQPPTLTHVSGELENQVSNLITQYRQTVAPDIAFLLSQYTVTDIARRVVGVGSVGTRCFIAVLTNPNNKALVLQIKQAGQSVLNQYGALDPSGAQAPDAQTANAASVNAQPEEVDHGLRVMANQRILQAVSDPFLGYFTYEDHGYYVRQFRDHNVSVNIDTLKHEGFLDYVDACGRMLARAHAQSPNAAFIMGYLGESDTFDRAVTQWAHAYADQSYADYARLRAAVESDTFPLPDESTEG